MSEGQALQTGVKSSTSPWYFIRSASSSEFSEMSAKKAVA